MIKYLKNEEFKTEVSKGKVLVDFYADWCGPCQRMGEILESVNANILKVNTDEHQDLAMSFGIMSIPTLILFQDGKEVKKVVGLQSKDEIEELLKS